MVWLFSVSCLKFFNEGAAIRELSYWIYKSKAVFTTSDCLINMQIDPTLADL